MGVWVIWLGVLQGIAEFLPISSSGHLALTQVFFGARADGITAVNVLLHAGTLAAVLIVYRKDLARLLPAALSLTGGFLTCKKRRLPDCSREERTVLYLLAATLPMVAVGIADALIGRIAGAGLTDALDAAAARRPVVIGALLMLNGVILILSERLAARLRPKKELTPRQALFVGVFQVCALLPGLSRSGMTIAAARICGLEREEALRFSLLLSIPAIGGSLAVAARELSGEALAGRDLRLLLLAAGVSFAVGLCALALLRRTAKKSFLPFGLYSLAAGAAAVIAGIIRYKT